MDLNALIAVNLKKLRMERNLSLGQLAERSTVSKVMLSQIEKGEANPTINTLWKIAAGLSVPYTALLERQEQEHAVVRKTGIIPQSAEAGHYRLYGYFPNTPHRNFELFQMELDEGFSHVSVGHSGKSEEYIMILEGELTLGLDDKVFVLQANDAISFSATAKHTYGNRGTGPLKAIIVNFYPARCN